MPKAKIFDKNKVKEKLKEILKDKSDDPRITIQVYERDAMLDLFKEVYKKGIKEGKKINKYKLISLIKKI